MNYKLILRLIGNMFKIEALFMLFPIIISFIYETEEKGAFLLSILILLILGFLLTLFKPESKQFRTRDAFAAAALTWLLLSVFGALPFYFSGCFNSFIDCIFESISGFTTTGASILTEIESLPQGILLWRSLSHWIGGMGVLMFMLAVIPTMNASSVNLLRAESTGPSPSKVVPKIRQTARVMYVIYFAITLLLIVLLLISGFPLYDTLIHSFSTAGTGGFSNMNASVGAYNNVAAEIIITTFMFLFGISFSLYFLLLGKNFKQVFKDEELKLYFAIVIASIIIITVDTAGIYHSMGQALRHSSFQVSSIISTTGFSTTDFNIWPTLSRVVLVFLMITGCCAGSTGGGIKLARFLILFKFLRVEINNMIHPRSTKLVTVNGKKVSNDIISKTALYFFIYFMIFTISVMLISIDKKDIVTSVTSVIAMLSNIGPGLAAVRSDGQFCSI